MDTNGRSDTESRRAEKQLIHRARRGDRAAMRELIDSHKDRLYAFIRRMVRNPDDAEEIAQDTLLKAFASLDSFKTEYRYSTWLFTIAYRLSLNFLRRRNALSGDVDFSTFAHPAAEVDSAVAQSDAARHLKAVVWQAVDRLSPPQRATVILFYRHEQGCQEIAQVLELPVATVKSHLHRARGRLREMLQPVVAHDSPGLCILKRSVG